MYNIQGAEKLPPWHYRSRWSPKAVKAPGLEVGMVEDLIVFMCIHEKITDLSPI